MTDVPIDARRRRSASTEPGRRRPSPRPPRSDGRSGTSAGGIGAVGVKELRGRMRGRRAFVILTIYLRAPRPASPGWSS